MNNEWWLGFLLGGSQGFFNGLGLTSLVGAGAFLVARHSFPRHLWIRFTLITFVSITLSVFINVYEENLIKNIIDRSTTNNEGSAKSMSDHVTSGWNAAVPVFFAAGCSAIYKSIRPGLARSFPKWFNPWTTIEEKYKPDPKNVEESEEPASSVSNAEEYEKKSANTTTKGSEGLRGCAISIVHRVGSGAGSSTNRAAVGYPTPYINPILGDAVYYKFVASGSAKSLQEKPIE